MNRLIISYYNEFESYHLVWKLKNNVFIFLLICLILFFASITGLFYFKNKNFIDFYKYGIPIFEVLVLYLFSVLEKQRDRKIVKKYRKFYKNNSLSLRNIKKRWLKEALAIPNYEYINLVEKIEKYYLIQESYKGIHISREKIYNFIFSTDSKNRVLAMFMGLVALFTALLISSGVNIESIFAVFQSISIFDSLITIIFICLFLFATFYIIKYTISMLFSLLDFVFDNALNGNKISKRKKQIFIAQLLDFAEFPKHKIRIPAQFETNSPQKTVDQVD